MQKPSQLAMLSALFLTASLVSAPSFASPDDNNDECHQHRTSSTHDGRDDDSEHSNDGRCDDNPITPKKVKLSATLNGDVQPGAYGNVKQEKKASKTVFEAEVTIPIPSSNLFIESPDEASAAIVTASLLRDGAEYAKCNLAARPILHKKRSKGLNTAEFQVKLKRYNSSSPRARRGSCSDISGAFVLPDLQPNDIINVSIDSYATGPFLTGSVK